MKTIIQPIQWGLISVLSLFFISCGVLPKQHGASDAITKGMASYYADKYHGNKTASGELYDKKAYTAAHKTYSFGTVLKVTNLQNGKQVEVRVNDRGPFVKDRIIDVSRAAAEKLDLIKAGVAQVQIEVVGAKSTGKAASSKKKKR